MVGLAVALAALIVGWQVYESGQDSEIREGAVVAGVDIGGLEPEEAVTALEPVVQDVAETTVELQFLDQTITVTAADLGISVDAERTLAEADYPPPPVVRPAAWLYDLFASRDVDLAVTTDLGTLANTVDPYTDPETPRIELVDGAFRPVLSTDVPVPDMELLAQQLEEAVLRNVGGTVVIEVPVGGMEPADPIAVALATALAVRANDITAGGVTLQLEGTAETFSIGELQLRHFLVLEGEQHDTQLALDSRIAGTLASLFVGIGAEGIPATLGLDEAGNVTISDGLPGFRCCHETAAEVLLAGMMEGQDPVILPAAPAPHPRGQEWAELMGITHLVAEFTTPFRPGQDRIINIARISELTRGVVIEPGQRFSVNGHVGPRTVANGFVPAAMILDGVFVDSVGRRNLAVRDHAVQRGLLRGARLHRLPEPLDLPQPLPLRARGHRLVPGPRPGNREQHALRGDAMAHHRRQLDHGAALLDPLGPGRADQPVVATPGDVVYPGGYRAHPDLAGGRAERDRHGAGPVPPRGPQL